VNLPIRKSASHISYSLSYMRGGIFVIFNYERARHFEGKIVRFRNEDGERHIGRVAKVTKEGIQIEELIANSNEGYGYGLWGSPRPFLGYSVLFDLLFF